MKNLDILLKRTTLKNNSSSIGALMTVSINDAIVFVKTSSPALLSEFAVSIFIRHIMPKISKVVPNDITICV
ncbi:MAG: hypothetical protein E7E92_09700, partial [Clostridiales bacterium]|nr:hypothetical protein [Clostridiales bacterium]